MTDTKNDVKKEPSESKVYGYVRVSTNEQNENGHSMSAQCDMIYKYADLHNLNVVSIITDVGSGKNMAREGIEELASLAREKKVTHLVVVAIDRLSRRVRDLLFLVDEILNPNDVEFVSIREHLDTTSPHGKMVLTMIGAFAELERNLISERTRVVIKSLKENDRKFTRHAPYGYKWKGKAMVSDPVECEILDKIIELDSLGLGPTAIGRELDELEMKSRNGGLWNKSTVHCILKRHYDEARRVLHEV